jgi:hypothetical protein
MSELASTAKCTICGKLFAGPRLALVGRGLDLKNNRISQFTEKLARHIAETHPERLQQIVITAGEYQGVLMLSCFSTDDKDLAEQMDLVRWKTNQQTLPCRISDQQISDAVESIVPDLLTLADMRDTVNLKRNLTGFMLSMRDRMQEPGKYVLSPLEVATTPGKAS